MWSEGLTELVFPCGKILMFFALKSSDKVAKIRISFHVLEEGTSDLAYPHDITTLLGNALDSLTDVPTAWKEQSVWVPQITVK